MAKFSKGEIAILARHPDINFTPFALRLIGREVEIISDAYRNTCFGEEIHYDIAAPWLPASPYPMFAWCAAEKCLIKRRPPPDWNSLSTPQDTPIKELA